MTKIKATAENKSGRNTHFRVGNRTNVSRATVVREIKNGQHQDYHVRKINGVDTPVSNPDKTTNNNIEK